MAQVGSTNGSHARTVDLLHGNAGHCPGDLPFDSVLGSVRVLVDMSGWVAGLHPSLGKCQETDSPQQG